LAVQIQYLLAEKLLVEVESPEEDLLKAGVLDSLALIQLLVHIEERFGVKISLDDLEIDDLRSVNSIACLVSQIRNIEASPRHASETVAVVNG
jgi:acyl carrier protein